MEHGRKAVVNDNRFFSENDLAVPLPDDVMDRLAKGRVSLCEVLPGTTRPNKGQGLYAKTYIELDFEDEENLQTCVKLLYWSDQRLSKLPDLVALWDWQATARDGMTIKFSTGWYDKEYFDARKYAFAGRDHQSYYELFGAKVQDLRVRHEIQ